MANQGIKEALEMAINSYDTTPSQRAILFDAAQLLGFYKSYYSDTKPVMWQLHKITSDTGRHKQRTV